MKWHSVELIQKCPVSNKLAGKRISIITFESFFFSFWQCYMLKILSKFHFNILTKLKLWTQHGTQAKCLRATWRMYMWCASKLLIKTMLSNYDECDMLSAIYNTRHLKKGYSFITKYLRISCCFPPTYAKKLQSTFLWHPVKTKSTIRKRGIVL